MRLQAESLPDAVDRRRRITRSAGHRAQAPVRHSERRLFQGADDDRRNLLIADLEPRPGARLVQEPVALSPGLSFAAAPYSRLHAAPLPTIRSLPPLCSRLSPPIRSAGSAYVAADPRSGADPAGQEPLDNPRRMVEHRSSCRTRAAAMSCWSLPSRHAANRQVS